MSRILNLNHHRTKRAMKHPLLVGKPTIGRGMFCNVFDNGKTVLKLTADRMQYCFYTDYCRPTSSYFPKLIENHGPIGDQGDLDLYLVEMEKLTPLGLRKDVSDRAWTQRRALMEISVEHRVRIISKHWGIRNPVTFNQTMSREILDGMRDDTRLSDGLRDACCQLSDFSGNYGASLDFHKANFMLRGKRLVLNDVVSDTEIVCSHRSRVVCYDH